jgi:hypothetical protein
MAIPNKIDVRLHAMKAVDGILAALQTTFAQTNLLGDDNPYLFVDNDPKGSKVWICDPDAREGYERSGNRMLITVARGDCQPMNMHLHNRAQDGSWNSPRSYSDLYQTPVMIRCEAGNKTESEILASIAEQILKFFREDLMKEFDIYEIKVNSVSSPGKIEGVQGEPWQTSVMVSVQTQEMFQITTLMNQLNRLNIVKQFVSTAGKIYDSGIPPSLSVTPQNPVGAAGGPTISLTALISSRIWTKPITYTWTQISGPGTTTFGTPDSAETTASFNSAGTYILQCAATDGTFIATDSTTVTVIA